MIVSRVTVTVPSQPMMYNPQQHPLPGQYQYPVQPHAYTPPPGKEVWQDCEGAIVEGGALEIRSAHPDGGYDVVRGYGPLGYLSFVNEVDGD